MLYILLHVFLLSVVTAKHISKCKGLSQRDELQRNQREEASPHWKIAESRVLGFHQPPLHSPHLRPSDPAHPLLALPCWPVRSLAHRPRLPVQCTLPAWGPCWLRPPWVTLLVSPSLRLRGPLNSMCVSHHVLGQHPLLPFLSSLSCLFKLSFIRAFTYLTSVFSTSF